jgi:hypothetical protein
MKRPQARPSRVEARAPSPNRERARPNTRQGPRVVAQNAPSPRVAIQPRANGRSNAGTAHRDPRRDAVETPGPATANGAEPRGWKRGNR